MTGAARHEEINAVLVAYARREIDATTAGTRVCDVVERVGHAVRCALVTTEPVAERVLAGIATEAEAALFTRAVDLAAGRRLVVEREGGDAGLWTGAPSALAWIAVEPITTRRGLHVGALVAGGPQDVSSDVSAILPGVALVCELIAFELLGRTVLGRRLHRFNNLLARLAANVEQASALVNGAEPPLSRSDHEALATCTRFAFESLRALLDAGIELENALPLGATPLRARHTLPS